jgi:hypothetical protein
VKDVKYTSVFKMFGPENWGELSCSEQLRMENTWPGRK